MPESENMFLLIEQREKKGMRQIDFYRLKIHLT